MKRCFFPLTGGRMPCGCHGFSIIIYLCVSIPSSLSIPKEVDICYQILRLPKSAHGWYACQGRWGQRRIKLCTTEYKLSRGGDIPPRHCFRADVLHLCRNFCFSYLLPPKPVCLRRIIHAAYMFFILFTGRLFLNTHKVCFHPADASYQSMILIKHWLAFWNMLL
mgnify:CR=1 FL=1